MCFHYRYLCSAEHLRALLTEKDWPPSLLLAAAVVALEARAPKGLVTLVSIISKPKKTSNLDLMNTFDFNSIFQCTFLNLADLGSLYQKYIVTGPLDVLTFSVCLARARPARP